MTGPERTGQNGTQSVVAVIDERHERNRDLRTRYVELEKQLEDENLSDKQAAKLARKLQEVAEEFVTTNSGIAGKLVRTWTQVSTELIEDTMSTLLLKMWECFLSWDPARATYGTYVFRFLKGDAGRFVRREQFPWLTYQEFVEAPLILRTCDELELARGTKVQDTEIADMLNIRVETVAKVRRPPRQVSLDAPVGESMSRHDLINDELTATHDSQEIEEELTVEIYPDTEQVLGALVAGLEDESVWASVFRNITEDLTPRERYVLLVRSGFAGEPLTLLQLADKTGVGREILRRCEERALRKITDGLRVAVTA